MKKFIICLLVLLILGGAGAYYFYDKEQKRLNETKTVYLGSDRETLTVYTEEMEEKEFPRGTEVQLRFNKEVEKEEVLYNEFLIGEEVFLAEKDRGIFYDDRSQTVLEKLMYTALPEVVYEEVGSVKIAGSLNGNEEVEVVGFHELRTDGSVDYYKVRKGNIEGYIKGDERHLQHVFHDLSYDGSIYDSVSQNGGAASSVTYFPKDVLEGKQMPDVAKTLYINAGTVWQADEYIRIAQETAINAFVIDIKDTHIISYDSDVVREYSPSSNEGVNTKEQFAECVRKLKDAGYYTIGRITVFKDPNYAADHPETVIMENGDFYYFNGSYWPSIFSRDVWEYNVALAKEAVEEFGFDEIQFDYVRSPEYVPEGADMHNEYGETRVAAITNFIRYAVDVLHEAGAFVSIDVFGEISGDFVTAYGQYWEAISNAADVISSMPYPDHFAPYAYGIPEPWNDPYSLMYWWGSDAKLCQEKTYDPAKVRTWIQVYDSVSYGTPYDTDMVLAQIRGLEDAGVNDGYITWNGAASVGKFDTVKEAFR